MMTLLKAIIRPNKVDAVKDGLEKIGAGGITVTEVRGHGHQKGHAAVYRGREYRGQFAAEKIQVEVVVPNTLVEQAVQVIIRAARTGEVGNGRVVRASVAKSSRIRTGGLDFD